MNKNDLKEIMKELTTHNRKVYGDTSLIKTFPRKQGGKLEFFKLDKWMSADEVDKEYEKRGLVPAHPIDLAKYDINKMDKMKFVATQWKDEKGNHSCFAFGRWDVERYVRCDRGGYGWGGYWFLSGVPAPRKSSDLKNSELSLESLELRIKNLEDIIKHHNL